jgi:hypothetical protein
MAMSAIQVSTQIVKELRAGVQAALQHIHYLETTSPRELTLALRRELTKACNAIPDDEWAKLPVYIIEWLEGRLAMDGVAGTIASLANEHVVYILRQFPPEVEHVLRRFDTVRYRTTLAVLGYTLGQHTQASDVGCDALP